MTDFITMAHGNGGATMQELIRDYFVEAFDNVVPLTMSRYAVLYQNICLVALFWKKAYHWKL